MQKLVPFLLVALLSGCVFPGVYKLNIQQGNIVTEEELATLETGMTRSQVHSVLGTPLLLHPNDDSREYYVYTFQRGGGDIVEQQVIVYYDDNGAFSHTETRLLEETPAY